MELSPSQHLAGGVLGALPAPWPAVAGAFLTEIHLRGGSERTPTEYARILERFFTLFGDPGAVTPIAVHSFAYGRSPGREDPAAATICVRLAAISGFYGFACRLGAIDHNPAAGIRRPRPQASLPHVLGADELHRLLDAIPRSGPGLRDRAIVLLMVLSGLRRSEVTGLLVADIDLGSGAYRVRVKGGGERRRTLPPPVLEAIRTSLAARSATPLGLGPDAPLFAISGPGFYANLRRYAARAGLGVVSPHDLRHSAARLRRRSGATLEEVCAFLGHASIATTATYLRRLDVEPDGGWRPVAQALGVVAPAPGGYARASQWRGRRNRPIRTQTPSAGRRHGRPVARKAMGLRAGERRG